MKKIAGLAALMLAAGCAAVLSGCGGCMSCTSCSSCGKKTRNTTLTNSNWYTGTGYGGIQNNIIEGKNGFSPEKIRYDVTYDGTGASNSTYAVEYRNGSYTTEFYAVEYDWKKTGVPEGYAVEAVEKEYVYCLKTELTIEVRYALKNSEQTSDWYSDHIISESYFRSADDNLQPVYSKRDVVSHSPRTFNAGSLEKSMTVYDALYKNYYNFYCTEVTTYSTDRTEENAQPQTTRTGKLNKTANSLFDNYSLYTVLRSMNLTADRQSISIYDPSNGGVEDYNIVHSDAALAENEAITAVGILRDNGLYAADEELSTVAAVVTYGGELPGTEQTAWYAAIKNADNNVSRSVMLKLEIPLSYALGKLNVTIAEIQSKLADG